MINILELCKNLQIMTLHLLSYQDIEKLLVAYKNAKNNTRELFYFRELIHHILVTHPAHLQKYLKSPLNAALPFHQLSLAKQYSINQPIFRNYHRVIEFLRSPYREEEKKYFIENYLHFDHCFKKLDLKIHWIIQILEANLKLHEKPDILFTLASLYSQNEFRLTWRAFNEIDFKNLLEKTVFLSLLTKNLYIHTYRHQLLLGFVNSDIPFEYKQFFFSLGLDNHLYSASKVHFQAFLSNESLLSNEQKLQLIHDALQKPVLNLAFLLSLKNHPLYDLVIPSARLQTHYDCIERLQITETIISNIHEEYIVTLNYQNNYNPMEIEGVFTPEHRMEMAALHGFISLNILLSYFQYDPLSLNKDYHQRSKLFSQLQHHPQPLIKKYLKHAQYEMSCDINFDSDLLVLQMLYENNPHSSLHKHLFLKLNLRQFKKILCWLDLNRLTSAILNIYSFKVHDKYLNWWLDNLEKKITYFKKDDKLDTFRLKITSLRLLIKNRGIQSHYLYEILNNLNFLEKVHLFRHKLRTEDYNLLFKLFNLNNRNQKQLPHQQKMKIFLKQLFTNPSFQLQNSLENHLVYLNTLADLDILPHFKIQIIFAMYQHTHHDMQIKLLDHLIRINEQNPQLIHQVLPLENHIKMNMALLILNPYQTTYQINKIILIITLLKENNLIDFLPPSGLHVLRSMFISFILQTLNINLTFELGDIIIKASPIERVHQCNFLFRQLISCPYISIDLQAKIVQYLLKHGEKIIETQSYHHLLETSEIANSNLNHRTI